MNLLLQAIVARAVARQITAAGAIEEAWEAGIREGMARQRVAHALHAAPTCTAEERAVLDAMASVSPTMLRVRELNDDYLAEACEAELARRAAKEKP